MISSTETLHPRILLGSLHSRERNSISPRLDSVSAPPCPKTIMLSLDDVHANATRHGIHTFISPGIIFADGLYEPITI